MNNQANNNQLCKLYLVRHGETEWNKLNKIQGQLNSPLTAEAIKQTKDLAAELKHIDFTAIFSSDLGRAVQTAEILALEHKIKITTNKLLRERHLGILQGSYKNSQTQKLREMIQNLDNMKRLKQIDSQTKIESPDKLTTRLIQALREISLSYPNEKVLIVTHSGAMRHLLKKIAYPDVKNVYQIKIENLGYFVLESDGPDFFLKKTHGIYLRD
ncbi:MAG: histidine phosphatase family protein [Patescibacteria group bacterium]|nr:histidine phosphatase family protein [Patescibacteria group bacterium]